MPTLNQRVQVKSSGRYGVIMAIDHLRYLISFWYATGDEPFEGWFTVDEFTTLD